VVLLAVTAFLVAFRPSATVAGVDLVTKVNLTVQCSSLWEQWTHHARPAALNLNGKPLTTVQAAQSACQSGSHKIKEIGAGLVVAAVAAVGASFLFRRPAVRRARPSG
jgi:hypothetical protein